MAFLSRQNRVWLMGIWLCLGGILRCANLGRKAPWSDEFATLLYSRGDDYGSIPIAKILSLEILLKPLQGYPVSNVWEVAELLIQRNNHPPLFFMLVNIWQRFFPLDPSGYSTINGVRSLAVVFGIISILAMYWVAKLAFHSELIAHISAALMAFSPFAVYLSQEARHYTLIILVAIASLGFCLVALGRLREQQVFTTGFMFSWFCLNCLGLLIHYFFVLTLAAEAIAFVWSIKKYRFKFKGNQLLSLWLLASGVVILGVIWRCGILPKNYGSSMTDWTYLDYHSWLDMLFPFWQMLATLGTMLIVFPSAVSSLPMLIFFSLAIVIVNIRLMAFWQWGSIGISMQKSYQPSLFFINRFILISWIIFGIIIFGFGIDISRAGRYSFVYFPGVVLSVAAALGYFWEREKRGEYSIVFFSVQDIFKWLGAGFLNISRAGSRAIALILLLSFCGGLSVVGNLSFQKPYDAETVIDQLVRHPQMTILLTPHQSTVEIGEMMGIAWEAYRRSLSLPLYFGFIPKQPQIERYNASVTTVLETVLDIAVEPQILQKMKEKKILEFQLWAINFFEGLALENCDFLERESIRGYYSDLYHCTMSLENEAASVEW